MSRLKIKFTPVTKQQCMEFGLVAILVCLFLALRFKDGHFVTAAFIITLCTIIIPRLFYPLAVGWFGMSGVLGVFSSALLLGLVFLVVIVPVGLFRRARGIDGLKLRQFKKGRQSVMTDRNHVYTCTDLQNTF
jgi:hypothetical protein